MVLSVVVLPAPFDPEQRDDLALATSRSMPWRAWIRP